MQTKAGKCLALFWTFFKIGAFTFGGGYAMIPLIQKETVEKKQWITEADILNVIAIAESTPGPIAINAATFIGYTLAGVPGAACATFGVVLPSFALLSLISALLTRFAALAPVRYAFYGVRAGVLALLCKALWSMAKQCPKKLFAYVIALAAFLAVAFLKINVFYVLLGCAALGLLSALLVKKEAKK